MIDKKTRAMIDTFRLFSSKNSKVSEPRVLKHITKFLFSVPTASIQKRLCRKSRAHKKVTITREWKLMCQIMRSWIKLIYKQHNYFNLLAKAPRFVLRVEQGATSSINQELFQLFQIYYTFGEKVSCGFAFFFHVSWYLPAKLNEYSLVNSSQEYEEEDHYYYNGYHENYEEESDGERSYRPRRLRRRRGNFTSMRRFFHDSKFFVETRDRPIIN